MKMSVNLQNSYGGDINITSSITTLVWKIENFSVMLNDMKVGEYIESPMFSIRSNLELKFNIQMFPKGKENCKEYVSLTLISYNDAAIKVEYKFVLLDSENKENYGIKYENVFNRNSGGWGALKFVQINELLEKKNELIVEDVLTILCEMKIDMTTVCNKQPSDIIFSFDDGRKYHAHKNVLAANSTVFANMFERNANVNDMKIENVDFSAFNLMLQFIYLKQITLAGCTLRDLLNAADKYAIEELTCESGLCESINIDYVCDFLNLVHKNNLKKLKAKAIDLIKSNRKELINGNELMQNLVELPKDLTAEVFKLLLSEGHVFSDLAIKEK